MKKRVSTGQYWKETSLAIKHDDKLFYIETPVAGCDGIRFKIVDSSVKDTRVFNQSFLEIHEVEALISMFTEARDHYYKMEELNEIEKKLNGDYDEVN
jgi:hypothetical protein